MSVSTTGFNNSRLYVNSVIGILSGLITFGVGVFLYRRFLMQRRRRRRVEEINGDGTSFPPPLRSTGSFLFVRSDAYEEVDKPTLWEVYVGHGEQTSQKPRNVNIITEWELNSMRPLSAEYVVPHGQGSTSEIMENVGPNLVRRLQELWDHGLFATPSTVNHCMITTSATLSPPVRPSDTPPSTLTSPKVRVAVLIAMPQSPQMSPPLSACTSTISYLAYTAPSKDSGLSRIELGLLDLDVDAPPSTAGG